ncbi:MAG: HEAT repeat domain-containing protein [Coriobacteriales bacterium]
MEDAVKIAAMATDADAEVRGAAADALGSMDEAAAFPLLVNLLADPDRRVRIAAVRSLGNLRSAHAFDVLLPLLEEGDAELTCEVLAAFAKTGDERAFAPVVVRLFDVDDAVRQNAAAAVGRLRNPSAFEPLMMCLDDDVEWVRANSALSLGQLGCVEAASRLREIADSQDTATVRANAVTALGELASADTGISPFLMEVAGDAAEDARVRVAAVLALASGFQELGKRDEDLASRVLGIVFALAGEEPDDDVRSTCIWALGELCRAESVEELGLDPAALDQVAALLEKAQGDPHEWCARYAEEALVKVRG